MNTCTYLRTHNTVYVKNFHWIKISPSSYLCIAEKVCGKIFANADKVAMSSMQSLTRDKNFTNEREQVTKIGEIFLLAKHIWYRKMVYTLYGSKKKKTLEFHYLQYSTIICTYAPYSHIVEGEFFFPSYSPLWQAGQLYCLFELSY